MDRPRRPRVLPPAWETGFPPALPMQARRGAQDTSASHRVESAQPWGPKALSAHLGRIAVPRRDLYHDAVVRALEKAGWTITADPLRLVATEEIVQWLP